MATEIFLPRLTHDMRSGIFVRWLKEEGERVNPGEALFEIESDKAVTEIAAEAGGIFYPKPVEPGDEIPIGRVIAYLLAEGEAPPEGRGDSPAARQGGSPARPAGRETQAAAPEGKAAEAGGQEAPAPGGRVVASPIARRMARELGIDLRRLAGSGPGGRIIEADVQAVEAAQAPFERVPLTRLQAVTGQRMMLSSQTIPQFVLEVDVDMGEVVRLRPQMAMGAQEAQRRPSYTAILVKAAAGALRAHTRVNASFEEGFVRYHTSINIGVAVATQEGLLVPVIHQADRLSVQEIQAAMDDLREQARRGSLPAQALAGGTFTISNLGMYGVDRFQALVNPPQAAILAAGRIRDLPWAGPDGVQIRPILTLRLAADHRVLDGATAAPFLAVVRVRLEAGSY